MSREDGFTLLDVMVCVALLSGVIVFGTSAFGMRAPATHPAALALEAALVEARSIATMQQTDGTDMGDPAGATVSVAPDPRDTEHSIISVFRSRPIANPNISIDGQSAQTNTPPPDAGFPPQTVPAIFVAADSKGGMTTSGTGGFTIMISGGGYTSFDSTHAWKPGDAYETGPDPGCVDTGVTISAMANGSSETHAFDCQNATYNVSATPSPTPAARRETS